MFLLFKEWKNEKKMFSNQSNFQVREEMLLSSACAFNKGTCSYIEISYSALSV
jgi:chitinase